MGMSDKKLLDPRDYMITRKRKQYKFAKFHNSPLCFEFDEWQKQSADCVEVGAGTGLFSVELATRYPDKRFVALDVKGDRLQKGAYEAEARGLINIRFVRARADQLEECFEPQSLESVWVTFPDPFPKKRSAGRRLTHPTFLRHYQTLLKPHGSLFVKHDNLSFFTWSLEQLVAERWRIAELSFDLHDSDLSDDYKIQTTYETRWLKEGSATNFVKAGRI
jgi:tRNA (guanine-N7-)-methyltransferase